MSTKVLLDAISNGDAKELSNAFNAVMNDKIVDHLEDKRQEVAQNLFGGSFNESPDSINEDEFDLSDFTMEELAEEFTPEELDEVVRISGRAFSAPKNTEMGKDTRPRKGAPGSQAQKKRNWLAYIAKQLRAKGQFNKAPEPEPFGGKAYSGYTGAGTYHFNKITKHVTEAMKPMKTLLSRVPGDMDPLEFKMPKKKKTGGDVAKKPNLKTLRYSPKSNVTEDALDNDKPSISETVRILLGAKGKNFEKPKTPEDRNTTARIMKKVKELAPFATRLGSVHIGDQKERVLYTKEDAQEEFDLSNYSLEELEEFMQTEEFEQLSEDAMDYIRAAYSYMDAQGKRTPKHVVGNSPKAPDLDTFRRIKNRRDGIGRAQNKLMKTNVLSKEELEDSVAIYPISRTSEEQGEYTETYYPKYPDKRKKTGQDMSEPGDMGTKRGKRVYYDKPLNIPKELQGVYKPPVKEAMDSPYVSVLKPKYRIKNDEHEGKNDTQPKKPGGDYYKYRKKFIPPRMSLSEPEVK